jgi:hypothetical protein
MNMTDYMKLSEILLDELPEEHPWKGNIKGLVETLIAKGVTIQKRGRWIYGEQDEDNNIQANCSVCGAGDRHAVRLMHKIPYCWKCGAKMYGGNEDAER